MKINKNKQLVEDIFDDFILKSMGFSTLAYRDKALTIFPVKAYKELMGRESAGVVVYVSEYGKDCIINDDVDLVKIESEKTDYYNIKAIIQLVEEK